MKSKILLASILLSLCAPIGRASADNGGLVGVWTCEVVRPGTLFPRPIQFLFHGDGIVALSSQTNLAPNFTSRGLGQGEWMALGKNIYSSQSVELLYYNGNAGGRFLVDLRFYLDGHQPNDREDDTLCVGNHVDPVTGEIDDVDPCPTEGNVRLTHFQHRAPDGSIVRTYKDPDFASFTINYEADQFAAFHPRVRCGRVSQTKAYGKPGAIFPIPATQATVP